MKLHYILTFLLLSFYVNSIFGQDSTRVKYPKKAMIQSALLPGLGQAYNKKGWKIPIIYGGLASGIYFINYSNNKYHDYKKAYIIRTDNNPNTIDIYDGTYTEGNLITLQEYYKRNLEISYIITTGIYILNILDAYIDAHLFEFNVNEDLSLNLAPNYNYISNNIAFGINLSMKF